MLKKIPFLSDAAEIVYAHQERFDGSGYPRRLRGSDIPLGARIFSIADTLDAITSDRPYRTAKSIQVAREEIKQLSGKCFDPQVTGVFLDMPETIWEDLSEEINKQVSQFGLPNRPVALAAATAGAINRSGFLHRYTCPHCGKDVVLPGS